MPNGYYVPYGYMGKTATGWILFATEQDYLEYIAE